MMVYEISAYLFACILYLDSLTLASLYLSGMPGRELGVFMGAEPVLLV